MYMVWRLNICILAFIFYPFKSLIGLYAVEFSDFDPKTEKDVLLTYFLQYH